MKNNVERMRQQGFTLIEMSIVLVVIGLLVGGVLYGADLVRAAAIRSQVTQLEQFNTATTTFYGKFGGLLGDLQVSQAAQFGFYVSGCTGAQGERDGNGLLEGGTGSALILNGGQISGSYESGSIRFGGETGLFWQI